MIERHVLYRFFKGLTNNEENSKIKRWLEESPENMQVFLNERLFFDALLLSPSRPEKIPVNLPAQQLREVPRFRKYFKIASVVAASLIAFCIYSQMCNQNNIQYQTIYVPPGQRINIVLPDGSDVWLNACTKISYPIPFNKKQRLVKLDGEAFFNVTKDKNKPFIVEVSDRKIEVLGTEFNVIGYANRKDEFEVALIRGCVQIDADINKEDEYLMLKPRSKVYLKNGQLQIADITDYDNYRWRDGLICFQDESVSEILKKLEKYYNVHIEIRNQETTKVSYSGKFRITDGLKHALRILQKDIKFDYEYDTTNSKIIIH